MGEVASQTANTKPPTLDPSIVEELKQWPPCRPLDDVPFRHEVEEAIRALANRKAVKPDGLQAELLKVLAEERKFNTLGKFHDIAVAAWRGGGVPQGLVKVVHLFSRWLHFSIEALFSVEYDVYSFTAIVKTRY